MRQIMVDVEPISIFVSKLGFLYTDGDSGRAFPDDPKLLER